MRRGLGFAIALWIGAHAGLAHGQLLTVDGQVSVVTPTNVKAKQRGGVVVWLTPLGENGSAAAERQPTGTPPRLVQKDKRFEPHVLVVPAGTEVEFPNRDPFFHNVFSLFEGKRFDLGLYEAGTSRTVRFDRPGVSYIFCNIHPEMSAAVIAIKTPYYAISSTTGTITIQNVPAGRYQMSVWHEGSSPEALKALTREITISESEPGLGVLRVVEDSPLTAHKNKYGREYDTPQSQSSEYGPN